MDDAELRALALKIAEGRVIGTWLDVFERDPAMVPMVFMPLALMTDEQYDAMRQAGAVHVYGIVGEHGTFERSINGMPMFDTCVWLLRGDAEQLWPLVEQARTLRQSFTRPSKP